MMQQLPLSARVARQVFSHFNGIALGAVAFGLYKTGVLDQLAAKPDGVQTVDTLATDLALVPGYLNVAFDTLASENLCQITPLSDDKLGFTLTDDGRTWLAERDAYRDYDRLFQPGDPPPSFPFPTERMSNRVITHLQAPTVIFTMLSLAQTGWDVFSSNQKNLSSLNLLMHLGWTRCNKDNWSLTEEGTFALALAPKYAYPACYMPLLSEIPSLLSGREDDKAHVDREMDIDFSGKVFDGPCRDLFLKQLLPLFDHMDLASQPKAIVDSGCGDGTVLIETWRAIKEQTVRGRHLTEAPLLMIGAEYEEVAGKVADQALTAAGINHHILSADIAGPEDLIAKLKDIGINPDDVLHISKSVIHNRTFVPPNATPLPLPDGCGGEACHVTRNGKAISDRFLFNNLVAFFKSWSPFIGKHGMIAIEAHCWSPAHCKAANGFYPMTLMKTTHGFSRQYLVSADFYRAAAKTAGLGLQSSDNIPGLAGLPPTMTVDHLLSGKN